MNMLRSRIHYWNCGKFADYIRGSKKPYALGWDEWDEWNKDAAQKHPIRYWIAETGLKKLQDIVYYPSDLYYSIKTYSKNRWYDKCHLVNTGLKPGQYYEFDYKVLHGLFYELTDYVEVELARMQTWHNENKYNFIKGRCAEAGLDYLEWASSLTYDEAFLRKNDKRKGKLTSQAISAQKVRELYEWWTITRPNRPEPSVVAKYNEIVGDTIFDGKLSAKKRACLTKINKIEERYEQEDTDKLIELIKIRREIWT